MLTNERFFLPDIRAYDDEYSIVEMSDQMVLIVDLDSSCKVPLYKVLFFTYQYAEVVVT